MLPFRVIQIEQRRALRQNVIELYLPHFRRATKLLSERKLTKSNRRIPDLLSLRSFADFGLQNSGRPTEKNEAILQSGCTAFSRHRPKNRCYRKQTTKFYLTGARMHIRDWQKLLRIAQGSDELHN